MGFDGAQQLFLFGFHETIPPEEPTPHQVLCTPRHLHVTPDVAWTLKILRQINRKRIVRNPVSKQFQEIIEQAAVPRKPIQSRKAREIIPPIKPDTLLQFCGFQSVPLDWLTPGRKEIRPP